MLVLSLIIIITGGNRARGTLKRGMANRRRETAWIRAAQAAGLGLLLWVDAIFAVAILENGSDGHTSDPESIGLCKASPKQRKEYSIARYRAMGPSADIESFVSEWQRDLYPEETAKFQPLKAVRATTNSEISKMAGTLFCGSIPSFLGIAPFHAELPF